METAGRRTIRLGITVGLSLGAIVGVVGCGETSDDVEGNHEFAVVDDNGLLGVNGLVGTNGLNGVNGLLGTNGLTWVNGMMGVNGMSATNGLNGTNGLSATNGMMTSDAGRKTVAYLVKCALNANDSLVKQDQTGVSYTFSGGLGLCPEWKYGSIHGSSFRTCQNLLSACMMAHINTSGVHVPLWLASESSKIGWGTSSSYPKQEGTFFGNIIESGDLSQMGMPGVVGPKAYFCEGAGITAGAVAGRLGVGQAGVASPYTNPYGTNVKCSSGSTAAGPTSSGMTAPDGYKQACANGYCFQNGEPITVWRNPNYTPVFDQVYRYSLAPMHVNGKAVDVAYGDTTNGTTVQQYDSWGGDPQKFKIVKSGSSTNWKIALKNNSNKCLGPRGNGTVNGTRIEVQDCTDGSAHAWTITADANNGAFKIKHVASGRCLDVTSASTGNGATMQLYSCKSDTDTSNKNQRFKLSSSY
jgi:hypothetical protein